MSSPTLSTRFQRIAEQAADKAKVFTTLAHLIDVELLREAFGQLREEAAPGVDGQTVETYSAELDLNLLRLHERLRSQQYRATPARRVWIPKEDGGQRPLALPVLEDKLVQRAVVLLLTPIYERDFYEFSYGFRPGRGTHDALHALRERCMELGGVWLVDADVRGFFDSVNHGPLQQILRQRVNDGGIVRLVGKWLKAGILEGEKLTHPETGTPQGGVMTPPTQKITRRRPTGSRQGDAVPDHHSFRVHLNLFDQESGNALTLLNRRASYCIAQTSEKTVESFSQLKIGFLIQETSFESFQISSKADFFLP
jgi:RNA-directed DNA polymerase